MQGSITAGKESAVEFFHLPLADEVLNSRKNEEVLLLYSTIQAYWVTSLKDIFMF